MKSSKDNPDLATSSATPPARPPAPAPAPAPDAAGDAAGNGSKPADAAKPTEAKADQPVDTTKAGGK